MKIEKKEETESQRLAKSAFEAQERIKQKKAEKALAEEKARKEKETSELNAKQWQKVDEDE